MKTQKALQEVVAQISQASNDPKNAKIISVIGSCKTLHQLETCKAWFNQIVKDEESLAILSLAVNMRFGQINCGIDV